MMGDNPQLWVEWVQVRQGLPMIQDFLFCATWNDWFFCSVFTGVIGGLEKYTHPRQIDVRPTHFSS